MIYNPVQDSLIIYYDITIRIDYSGRDSRNILTNSRENVSPIFDDLYQKSIVNYDFLNLTRDELLGGYLIITPLQYYNAIKPLADWKIEKGIPTDIVTIASLVDTTYIKNTIIDYYNNNKIEYVLLVGNEFDIPLHNDNHAIDNNEPLHNDYWYSLISGDDDYADLFIGRLSAENAINVTTQVNKILDYELNPMNVTSMLLISDNDYYPLPPYTFNYPFQTSIERAEDILLDFNMNVITSYGANPPHGDGAVNQNIIDNFVNVGIVNYCGHGSGYFPNASITTENNCWLHWTENDDDFSVIEASNLENSFYPVVFSISCWNGLIDAEGDRVSLAEAFLWNENGGASGCLASTRSAIFASSYDFEQKLFKGAFIHNYNDIGLNIERAKNNIINQWPYGEGISDARSFLWFGDPQMSIYTDDPQEFTVAYSDSIIVSPGSRQLSVTVLDEDSDFVEGATVCLYKESQIYYRKVTTTYGQADFNINIADNAEGILKVTVTKDNFIPNRGEITIHFPPKEPENLLLVSDEPNIILSWSPVTEDIVGNPETITNYRIYRNISNPDFEPNLTDLLSTTEDTTFTDYGVMYNYPKAFYKVTAVSFLSRTGTKIGEKEITRGFKLESSPASTFKSYKTNSFQKEQNR